MGLARGAPSLAPSVYHGGMSEPDDEIDSERIARLVAAKILRRQPDFARQRERDRIDRVMETEIRRQLEWREERLAILEAYRQVVADLLGSGWRRVTAGRCAVCEGLVNDRDLAAVLDELRERSDEVTPRVSGPALLCPSGHVSHLVCMRFQEIDGPERGDSRIVGQCEICAAREG